MLRRIIAALACAAALLPSAAFAAKFTFVLPKEGGDSFYIPISETRPIRFVAAGHFDQADIGVFGVGTQAFALWELGYFVTESYETYFGGGQFHGRSYNEVYDANENDDCVPDPSEGNICYYDTLRYLIIDASNSSDTKPFRFSVSVTAVPEPAEWAMLTAGFGIIGAALRERYRRAGRGALAQRAG